MESFRRVHSSHTVAGEYLNNLESRFPSSYSRKGSCASKCHSSRPSTTHMPNLICHICAQSLEVRGKDICFTRLPDESGTRHDPESATSKVSSQYRFNIKSGPISVVLNHNDWPAIGLSLPYAGTDVIMDSLGLQEILWNGPWALLQMYGQKPKEWSLSDDPTALAQFRINTPAAVYDTSGKTSNVRFTLDSVVGHPAALAKIDFRFTHRPQL